MLSIQVFSAIDIGTQSTAISGPFCVVKFQRSEIGRTIACTESPREPFWNQGFTEPCHRFEDKVLENQRPFVFEYLEIELYLNPTDVDSFGVTRVKLHNFERPEWCRLFSTNGKSIGKYCGKVLVGITVRDYPSVRNMFLMPLSTLLPPCFAQYNHLYITFQSDPHYSNNFLGPASLPGPLLGEIILDRHNNVEWKVAVGNNAFGDKFYVTCKGSLYITDLRIIYIPDEVESPSWSGLPCIHSSHTNYTDDELLLIRRTTYQLPIGSIQDCRVSKSDVSSGSCSIIFEGRDNSVTEFSVRLAFGFVVDAAMSNKTSIDGDSLLSPSRRVSSVLPTVSASTVSSMLHENKVTSEDIYAGDNNLLAAPLYNNGLDTFGLLPFLWCSRVQDCITWLIREDTTWLRYAKAMKLSTEKYIDASYLKKIKEPINVDEDYQRLHVLEAQWNMSDINFSYDICTTYPQTLVFPSILTREDIVAGATQRSRGRLPALVWLHPQSHASLCRCAQPVVGLSGMPEHDRKVCVAIKNSCSTGLPIRIADARPRINAQANAMQGKGYENVSFLGGPSVASLCFLDIDNIHVMRSSLAKLRENANSSGMNDSTATSSSMTGSQDTIVQSKWLYHVSNVLRGSIGIAESLLIGHPVLVHCSDGWDRTSQLSALAQILIDPYYRTIEGFLLLVNKEWCSFGHKFEERLGETSHKETSPVFLQFLDCVYQLCMQFPTDFAFSTHLLVTLCNAAYSGYFSTFREVSELRRYSFVQAVYMSERMESEDLQYSSVFSYIRILLHSSMASMLVNPYYQKPSVHQAQLKYIRARCGVSDLVIWREGLFGLNQPNFRGFIPNTPSLMECTALTSAVSGRVYDYVSLHAGELPTYTRNHIYNFLQESSTIVPSIPYTWKNHERYHSIVMDRDSHVPDAKLDRVEVAVYRVQLWYKSIKAVEIALKNDFSGVKNKNIIRLLRAVVHSEMRLNYIHRLRKLESLMNDMRSFVFEILEESLTWCIRKEAAVARVIEYEQTSLNNSMIGQVSNLITNTSTDLYGVLSDSAFSFQSGMHRLGNQPLPFVNGASPDGREDGTSIPKSSEKKTLHSTMLSIFGKKKT